MLNTIATPCLPITFCNMQHLSFVTCNALKNCIAVRSRRNFLDKQFSCRCVPDDKRAFAMGMQYVFMKTIGLIPGPLTLGHLVDQGCRLWQDICGQKGRCFVYDVDLVSKNVSIFGAVISSKKDKIYSYFQLSKKNFKSKTHQVV